MTDRRYELDDMSKDVRAIKDRIEDLIYELELERTENHRLRGVISDLELTMSTVHTPIILDGSWSGSTKPERVKIPVRGFTAGGVSRYYSDYNLMSREVHFVDGSVEHVYVRHIKDVSFSYREASIEVGYFYEED